MLPEIAAIDAAKGWQGYYQAYRNLYREVLVSRWGLGHVTYAGHIHHTAIPDVSGQVMGGLSWAAYSQPSSETLIAFLTLFAELVRNEPHRATSNRYLFFTLQGTISDRANYCAALGSIADRINFSVLSLETQLALPTWSGPIHSVEALYPATNKAFESLFAWGRLSAERARREFSMITLPETLSALKSLTTTDALFVRSSILLSAFRLGIPPTEATTSIGDGVTVAALVARNRAVMSQWDESALSFFHGLTHIVSDEMETYLVQPGDILGRIVRDKYSVPFEHLWPLIAALNPRIKDPNKIVAGTEIVLPRM